MQEIEKTMSAKASEQNLEILEKTHILIKGARSNNLKNIDVVLPKFQLIVVTGVSGSGKSSLTMETLYAEGQRRYVESLSSYARQFLTRIKKPDVDYIMGICPAIAVEQRVNGANARSTVGSMTELNDYLRLLYARIGKMISPISGREVKRHAVSDVVDFISSRAEGAKIQLLVPLPSRDLPRPLDKVLALLMQRGFSRVKLDGKLGPIEELLEREEVRQGKSLAALGWDLQILVDRVVIAKEDAENSKRIADSVQTALVEGEGECRVEVMHDAVYAFSTRFELDGIEFPEMRPQLFNYNNPYGACTACEGYGMTMGIDENRVVPDDSLTVYEGALACWSGERGGEWLQELIRNAHKFDFPLHTPYRDLSDAQRDLLWKGNAYFEGLHAFFEMLEAQTYKIQNRVLLSRYRGKTLCPSCRGYRLRKEALYVKVGGKHLGELMKMPIDELALFFENLPLEAFERKVAGRLLVEVENRLEIMNQIGLGYLHLDRLASTLSGGETQRINLTRTLGSNLTNSLYILDEPSIGLHPKDTDRLVAVLKELRDLGNTVVVVEHEEEVIEQADTLIDIGPGAGIHGGHVVYSGTIAAAGPGDSLTIDYLKGHKRIEVPSIRRPWHQSIVFKGVRMHNLKDLTVEFPLGVLTVVTGVSGSGKSSLVKGVLYEALAQEKGLQTKGKPGVYKEMSGHLEGITAVEWVNQQPIGRSSRSNPVTYVKAYDYVRNLFAEQHMSKLRGFAPRHFSFNVEGGRCEECKGEGSITVEMQFLADVSLECEACKGQRFKKEVLDVTYKGKNIYDVLSLSIEEAIEFFEGNKEIIERIRPLYEVGLGYIQLGQSSSTLSGGEAQRVKLAYYLGKESTAKNMFFIFDEPTTGLHFEDIKKLLYAFNALIDKGHTVLVVEHNLDVVKCADWVIDLGPGGGKHGGQLIFSGIPESLVASDQSYTGAYLRKKLRAQG
jgi:excinuclease ABC subunit A